jgi:hypothetical protein
MKKIRREKLIGIIIHTTYMEISQGKLPLYLKQTKMSCFSFYLFSFFFYKITEQKGGRSPVWGEGWHQWKGEVIGKGYRRVNMVQKCVHM